MNRIGDVEQPDHPLELEIDQALEFQKRSWVAQRVAWAIAVLILLAAVVGLFGNGPFSNASVVVPGLSIRYERLERHAMPTSVDFIISPETMKDNEATLTLDRSFLEDVRIDSIVPEPKDTRVDSDSITYSFEVADISEPIEVTLLLEYDGMGIVEGRASAGDTPPAAFRQFVYP